MTKHKAMHQMPGQPGRNAMAPGETRREAPSDEADCTRQELGNTGSALIVKVLARENMLLALKRVRSNKGAAGIDGLGIEETAERLKTTWSSLRSQLLTGTYRPSPVRRVLIPKPGGGERQLGIPTVTDRIIQQALLQVLQPLLDPHFSEHSYGFRPGRSAHQAVLAAQQYVHAGRSTVVDVDLEKFFDTVCHDRLIDRLRKKVSDPGVIRLVRSYLNSGTMLDGVVVTSNQGTPQGGPLSPLLANVLLDDVDKELERRGHCFVRYADDANVYVNSLKAGQRVMALLRRLYTRLGLKVNERKSAVASAFGRKFLGYSLGLSYQGQVRRWISWSAVKVFKDRIRQITARNCGRSLSQVIERLRPYLLGWKAYFGLSQAPRLWKMLDEWIRRRLRALQLKQWRTGKTIYRELRKLGANDSLAALVASNSGRVWHNSAGYIHNVLRVAWFDRLGLVRLS